MYMSHVHCFCTLKMILLLAIRHLFTIVLIATSCRIWFFNRTSVPAAVTGSMTSIDTSTLGLPVAHYANSGCDINKFFGPQNLVFSE
jgi:hypothetical protein